MMRDTAIWVIGGWFVDSSRHQGSDQGGHQDDAYRRIEVITGRVRRRRWTPDEKAQILTESLVPGVQVSDVARRYNLNRGLLQTWRRQALRAASDQPVAAFVPIRRDNDDLALPAAASMPGAPAAPAGTIDVEIGRARVRVQGAVDLDALRQVLSVIGQGR
jgi:transposase